MKCPYCAEQIRDEAALCRFCGARRVDGTWSALDFAGERRASASKSNFTIASTGWLLLLSGAWSLLTLTSPVALFGALRGGLVAVLYNGTFGALFLVMGYALTWRKSWALRATAATSVAYTLDKLGLLLDPSARAAALGEVGGMLGELGPMIQQVMVMTTLVFLIGWWSFVLYLYVRRDYFVVHADRRP